MRTFFNAWALCFVLFFSGCAGNYTTKSGKHRNAWVDLMVVAAAMPNSNDSASTRARKNGFVSGYLSNEEDDYSGICACPYDTDRAGNRCGARSAWSKPNGASPNCDYDFISTQDLDERWELERENNY
ncbi:hypothetical protein L0668_20470 [Paraglaciecola aquimarina]|uniref:Lipoprotein n=1 Tax=Paraglaciecola algarum TaxID=3050085 RepID=A0ABS9DC00_9ALTE|nr:hypothetical protein [Paraglaciecola sp. G1-23]MCF2950495.1 hypothetical protein [Paraglaciecola sp. G1-23]